MNLRPSGLLPPSKAVEGFLYFKIAEGLSNSTITSYRYQLGLWLSQMGVFDLAALSSGDLSKYLAWLRTEYEPKRLNGDRSKLSGKTLRNHWVTLKSFFNWLDIEFGVENLMEKVPPPKFKNPPVNALRKEEIAALLAACKYKKRAVTNARKSFRMKRPTAERDIAAILVLLDTGIRAGEFCALDIGDFDQAIGRLVIKHGVIGGSKGGQGRAVFLGKGSRKALWRYLAGREEGEDLAQPLFLSSRNSRMSTTALRLVIKSIACSAQVDNCYPHRFRHTFAITYLRSGGDVFTLQAILGHRSLEMVQHYARVAEVDLAKAHRKASPVDNWNL